MPSSFSSGPLYRFFRIGKQITLLSGALLSAASGSSIVASAGSTFRPPVESSPPGTCTVGDVCSSGGKLYICSATDTWTVVGTQT